MNRKVSALVAAAASAITVVAVAAAPATAHEPSGAIFTTLPDGSEVNFNIYSLKTDVYLDGGPGPGAPQTAAGLDDGTYVFQVTDPSGRTLLSQDIAACRRFTVAAGIITGLVTNGCTMPHVTGVDVDHGAVTVQLMPYADTPNPGGEYKAWAVELGDFLAGCADLGVPNGLAVVDCGRKAGNRHGFVSAHSKTDNFKVGAAVPQEIDTRFWDASGNILDNRTITWTDTLGAQNQKHSYYAPNLSVIHEAHVEAVEPGTHQISVDNQTGCTVQYVNLNGNRVANGPATVAVSVANTNKAFTIFLDVQCG
jgi:hypothetical protein